jgi:hypothetical protein
LQNQSNRLSEAHPADSLGLALSRAESVLSALVSCHDAGRGGFVVSDQYVLQSVAAIEALVGEARAAFVDLCGKCDLGIVRDLAPLEVVSVQSPDVSRAAAMEDDILPPLPHVPHGQEPAAAPVQREAVATSYEDLLRKLTAAEIFAAERAGNAAQEQSPLLPLLKSLRQDLERFRAA